MVAHASVVSSKPKVELDSHADKCVVGDIVKSFIMIIDQSTSTVINEKMAADVPKQLMPQ